MSCTVYQRRSGTRLQVRWQKEQSGWAKRTSWRVGSGMSHDLERCSLAVVSVTVTHKSQGLQCSAKQGNFPSIPFSPWHRIPATLYNQHGKGDSTTFGNNFPNWDLPSCAVEGSRLRKHLTFNQSMMKNVRFWIARLPENIISFLLESKYTLFSVFFLPPGIIGFHVGPSLQFLYLRCGLSIWIFRDGSRNESPCVGLLPRPRSSHYRKHGV